jgi:hypothetical protein
MAQDKNHAPWESKKSLAKLWRTRPARPAHNKYDDRRLRAFLHDEILGGAKMDATGVLLECARMIQWAREGRTARSQALRLGIIAGTPVADLVREFKRPPQKERCKLSPQTIYEQRRKYISRMGRRSIISAAIADPKLRRNLLSRDRE